MVLDIGGDEVGYVASKTINGVTGLLSKLYGGEDSECAGLETDWRGEGC